MLNSKNNIWSLLVIIVVLILFSDGFVKKKAWKEGRATIRSDVNLYYNYLPAVFIHDDITLNYYQQNPELRNYDWTHLLDNGNKIIKMTYGLSVLYSPFFFIADIYANNTEHKANGYSAPYHFSISLCAIFYFILALILLRKLLLMFFNDKVVALSILVVTAGTNLFYYTVFEPGMPHVFNFFLITSFLYLTIRWHKKPGWLYTFLLGISGGLIVLIRPTNALIVLFFLLYGIHHKNDIKNRFQFYQKHWLKLLLIIILSIAFWIPQMYYWKVITGQWIFFSYANDEGFFFNNPQIMNILFSYKKGWLVYTPVMAIALAGIPLLWKKRRKLFWPVLTFIVVMIYVLSSWWNWWYGGGFGLRSFIDHYGLLAIPFAAISSYFFKKKGVKKYVYLTVVFILICFNLFQTSQYRHNAIHWDGMNKEAYWETFLKRKPTQRFHQLLTKPDRQKAKQGIYREIPYNSKKEEKRKALYQEYKTRLKNDSLFMDSIKSEPINSSEINQKIDDYISNHINDYIIQNKKDTLLIIKNGIRENQALMEEIEQKAKSRNISVDSMITIDAVYLFKQGSR